tara:strand:- start:29393 stop:29908 length:516 start_codon:yes stop_codon:yes gene_type:complete
MKAIKLKSQANVFVCQNKAQAMEAITEVGNSQREITRLETEINDITAAAIDERKDRISELRSIIETLSHGVQSWCEVNRDVLCVKGKTVNLTTGEVSWRVRPPKVSLRGMDKIIETLKTQRGMKRFIRVKEEVNKDAILADPKAVKDIKGISISSGVEDFVIKPFEVEAGE